MSDTNNGSRLTVHGRCRLRKPLFGVFPKGTSPAESPVFYIPLRILLRVQRYVGEFDRDKNMSRPNRISPKGEGHRTHLGTLLPVNRNSCQLFLVDFYLEEAEACPFRQTRGAFRQPGSVVLGDVEHITGQELRANSIEGKTKDVGNILVAHRRDNTFHRGKSVKLGYRNRRFTVFQLGKHPEGEDVTHVPCHNVPPTCKDLPHQTSIDVQSTFTF